MGCFDNLIVSYVANLDLPADTKAAILASNPQTIADVSLWLYEHEDLTEKTSSDLNPFSTQNTQNSSEIQIFSPNQEIYNYTPASFFDGGLVDTDDASWGLDIERTSEPETVQASASVQSNYSSSVPTYQSNRVTETETDSSDPIKESQDYAIESIRYSISSALDSVMEQYNSSGFVSKSYNSLKEYFDSEMSCSNVCRALYAEQRSLELLERAQDGNLTREEYFHAKFDTVIGYLSANKDISAEEKDCLYELFMTLAPEDLDDIIDKLKNSTNEQFAQIDDYAKSLIESGRELKKSRRSSSNNDEMGSIAVSIRKNGTIGAMIENASGKELMTFEEVYEKERGVKFNPEAIQDYDYKMSQYMMAEIVTQKAASLHQLLDEPLNRVENHLTLTSDPIEQKQNIRNLELAIRHALIEMYGDDVEKINQELEKLTGGSVQLGSDLDTIFTYDKSRSLTCCTPEALAKLLLKNIDNNAQKLLNGKTTEEYKIEMADAYKLAYGGKNASDLANAFVDDQKEITGKVRTGVEFIGAGVMVAGMFIAPPIALAGGLVASFGGIGVEALENGTKEGGFTEEEKSELVKEIMTNAALFAVGGVAGKAGSAAKAALLAEKCPKLAACIADIGLDSTISLLGDLVLTGEINLEGEGFSQLISVVAGHYQKIKGHKSPKKQTNRNSTQFDATQHRVQGTSTPKTNSTNTNPSNTRSAKPSDTQKIPSLESEIAQKLKCNDVMAKMISDEITAKPEIQDELMKIVDSGHPEAITIIRMANKDNIDVLVAMSKNKDFHTEIDIDGNFTKNDFQTVVDITQKYPQFKDKILDVVKNGKRTAEDFDVIAKYLEQYPQHAETICELITSNNNIKFKDTLSNTASTHIEQIVKLIEENPDLEKEIKDFLSVQRKADNDLSNPVIEARKFVEELKNNPAQKDLMIELSKDPNLDTGSIHNLLNGTRLQPLDENIDIIRAFAKKGYDEQGIIYNVLLLKKHPELSDIILAEPPKYDLIDKTPADTPSEIIDRRFEIKNKIENIASSELDELRKTLGDDYFSKVKWEEIIPENATDVEIKNILKDLNRKSKFFSRISVNENKYGKNIQWAHEMDIIEQCAQKMLEEGCDFDYVMNYISNSYRNYDISKTLDSTVEIDDRRKYSGKYRGYETDNAWAKVNDAGAYTPFDENGSYREYYHRLQKQSGKHREYKGIRLTEIRNPYGPYNMMHPKNSNVEVGMDYIKELNYNLEPLKEKHRNGEPLTEKEKKLANKTIAEMYFVMANIMPYYRGSNGISDITMRSLYDSLGIEMPALKPGVSLDLEAFCMDADDFVKKWNTFFE